VVEADIAAAAPASLSARPPLAINALFAPAALLLYTPLRRRRRQKDIAPAHRLALRERNENGTVAASWMVSGSRFNSTLCLGTFARFTTSFGSAPVATMLVLREVLMASISRLALAQREQRRGMGDIK
jgi:hypothetical protein